MGRIKSAGEPSKMAKKALYLEKYRGQRHAYRWVIVGAVEDMHRAPFARHVTEPNRERAKD